MLIRRLLRRMGNIARIPLRTLISFAWGVPFEEIKRPRMIYEPWKNGDGSISHGTRLSDTVYLFRRENIAIGDDVFVWHNTILDGTAGLIIEDGCQIGAHVGVFTHSSHVSVRVIPSSVNAESYRDAFVKKPVKIGKHTFVASGAMILAGCTIGKGCIIGAGAVVTSDLPDFAVFMGNPGQISGDSRVMDKLALRRIKDPMIDAWYAQWQGTGFCNE